MGSIQTETIVDQPNSKAAGLKLYALQGSYGDFRDDLARDGYAVVKGAIPKDRADSYASTMFSYLEDFGLGFDRNDLSTATEEHLPIINEKGMCMNYGLAHEKFMWDIRTEAGVREVFEKVYGTEDLLVSFDAANFTFPNRTDIPPNKPWPHQDQDPEKPGFRCLQGLVNLLPNGPNDGGLIVCKGGHLLSEEFHDAFRGKETRIHQWTNEWYGFKEDGMKWLKDHGTEWVKVCAEPGDLLIWDSRTPHYNLSSTSSSPRFCVYTCYMPVSDATQEDLIRKKAAFEAFLGTTHWPNAMHSGSNVAKRNGVPDPHNRDRPETLPVLNEKGFKLTGIPYIKA
ncbi:hypothetical protein V8E51_001285 [Hyaloscypha variabilis]